MALLDRVTTLVRANLNDLVDKAEDPEKMIKQVILDMQNQLMQVKTQVAIAIADQHLLEKKEKENADKHAEWMRRAEVAVAKRNDDELARAALERAMSCQQMQESFRQQVADQKTQVEALKTALRKLQQKLDEAETKADLLVAQSRRSRVAARAGEAQANGADAAAHVTFDRMKHKVMKQQAVAEAHAELLGESLDDRFASLERQEQIDRPLSELKQRKGLSA